LNDALSRIADGALTCRDIVADSLDRLDNEGRGLGAVLAVRERGRALALAEAADEARRRGEAPSPLAGLPIAIKDNIATSDLPTTAGSRLLEGYHPPRDATVVERLRRAGAVIVAKTNLDEFGMGSSNENSGYGPVRNPWDEERVPGGSSGGSAAVVAAGLVPLALGTDTGGSVRQPAAFCGVVGVKPSYGRVSRNGLVAFASSLDCIGPVAGDVAGAAALLSVIAGADPLDATSAQSPAEDLAFEPEAGLEGLTVGLPREYAGEGLDAAVRDAVRDAALALEGAGVVVRDVSLPHTDAAVAAYHLLADAEASSNLARYDGVRYGAAPRDPADADELVARTRTEGFGREVKRRIVLGTFALSAGYRDRYYRTAQRVRGLIASDFHEVFSDVDVLLAPVTPGPAFRLGERVGDPLAMYLSDIFTAPASLAGVAAASLPWTLTPEGLPVGVQLIAGRFAEGTLLRAAAGLELLAGPAPRPGSSNGGAS
jgi:aspartyl-tRNA(Asn)/glutamyl-tRNA(Gln) amidotransferase subunit A